MNRFSNFARSSLSAYLPEDGETVETADSALFPMGTFTAVIWSAGFASPADDGEREIILAERTQEGITAQRGFENTQPKAWNTGSLIANVVTADTLNLLSASAAKKTAAERECFVQPNDRFVFFSFAENEMPKLAHLPEAALYSGTTLTLVNGGTGMMQFVVISAAEGDSIGFSSAEATLNSGCTLHLCAEDGIWHIIGTGVFSPRSFINVNYSGFLSAAGAFVYADASMGSLYLTIDIDGALLNIPTFVLKSDNTQNTVNLIFSGEIISEISGAGDCVCFAANSSGGLEKLFEHVRQENRAVSVSGYYQIPKTVRTVFADTSEGYAFINLGAADKCRGQTVTIVRTDAEEGDVMVSDAEGYTTLTAQNEYAVYSCSGSAWYRTG